MIGFLKDIAKDIDDLYQIVIGEINNPTGADGLGYFFMAIVGIAFTGLAIGGIIWLSVATN